MIFNLEQHPHRRFNILTGEWILVSPNRSTRPWHGKIEPVNTKRLPEYEPECYLCPGNLRAGGIKNPYYKQTFVFTNDFSALIPEVQFTELGNNGLFKVQSEPGVCRVLCFSPKHDLTLAEMKKEDIEIIIHEWIKEFNDLRSRENINYVLIFENKGELMGNSNPHPHCQIWSEYSIPVEVSKELLQTKNYKEQKGSCLLCDYLELEEKEEKRIIVQNELFTAVVPFWAVWPYETLILSKRHLGAINELNEREISCFSEIIKKLTTRYDNLFNISFPYSAGIHQNPSDGEDYPFYHFHMHFYPPLLRSASIKKFMVGYEMLANPQRDITPEQSAQILKKLPDIHYLENLRKAEL